MQRGAATWGAVAMGLMSAVACDGRAGPTDADGGGRCASGVESGDLACGDGCDGDGDGFTDCADPECATAAPCVGGCGAGQRMCGGACVGTSSSAAHCGACDNACTGDETCEAGVCQPLPDCSAGCPIGSICDLARNVCIRGCLGDEGCPSAQICESRTCIDGCRDDVACGTGQICESLQCRSGCRGDAACAGDEICVDLACRRGCRDHGECASGEICDASVMACVRGCVDDTGCASTEICETMRCRTGCRDDLACGAGQICESLLCRSGCRVDADCGADSTCVAASLTCVTCAADADEAGDTTLSTSGPDITDSVTRVLCGPGDLDTVTWSHAPMSGSSFRYRESIVVDVSGAEADAVTTLTLSRDVAGATWHTDTITGNGPVTLRLVEQNISCSFGCSGDTWVVEMETTSETPVTTVVNVAWMLR